MVPSLHDPWDTNSLPTDDNEDEKAGRRGKNENGIDGRYRGDGVIAK